MIRLLALYLAVSLGAPAAPTSPDRYRVDAAVGGVARRDLREIGHAQLQYSEPFRVQGSAQVEHREKKKHYRFALDMRFALQGRRLEVLENKSRFSADAAELRDHVERVVPFFYLLRTLPVPAEADEPTRSYLARHGYFVIRYARRERWIEATLHKDDELVGTFRLKRGTPNVIERIEIPAREHVTILFTKSTDRE